MGRLVEPEVAPECGDGFRRGVLTEDHLGQVARQKLHREEDDERDRDQDKDTQRQALDDHLEYLIHVSASPHRHLAYALNHQRSAFLCPSSSQLFASFSGRPTLVRAAWV